MAVVERVVERVELLLENDCVWTDCLPVIAGIPCPSAQRHDWRQRALWSEGVLYRHRHRSKVPDVRTALTVRMSRRASVDGLSDCS